MMKPFLVGESTKVRDTKGSVTATWKATVEGGTSETGKASRRRRLAEARRWPRQEEAQRRRKVEARQLRLAEARRLGLAEARRDVRDKQLNAATEEGGPNAATTTAERRNSRTEPGGSRR
ncbi:hypothetical protein PIB30_007273 [Stylosanthes scabra]|uniref:Uncharacterized protein n=1 Tax=Stylosanthes scabra TaxID=79078 RepID=A0ABU6W5Q6_9FABA|nr:hypothetical protein [Stylosanthes scabra]